MSRYRQGIKDQLLKEQRRYLALTRGPAIASKYEILYIAAAIHRLSKELRGLGEDPKNYSILRLIESGDVGAAGASL